MDPAATYANDRKPIDRLITFETADAERRIRSFDIDCERLGLSMRLMDVLRIMAAEGTRNGLELRIGADSRGDDVRVYGDLLKDGVPLLPRKPILELDQWDEIHTFGFNPEAIKVRCLSLHQDDR